MAQSVASTSTFFPRGRSPVLYTASVARTDTTAKDLFSLKAGDIPTRIWTTSTAVSNAGTSATLSIGSTSNVGFFVTGMDLKGTTITSGGVGLAVPSSAANLSTPLSFDTNVQATYAEAGTASTTGGPWIVYMEVLTV